MSKYLTLSLSLHGGDIWVFVVSMLFVVTFTIYLDIKKDTK